MVQKLIESKLAATFSPAHLRVVNQSHKHAGHAEAKAHGGGHYDVEITAAAFEKLPLIKRHRLVYAALADLLENGQIHALHIVARSPSEVTS